MALKMRRWMEVEKAQNAEDRPVAVLDTLVLLGTASVGLAVLGWLWARCRYGFDFTDESFYLIWMSNPWIYDFSFTTFGYMYHPLHRLLGGDIVLLRQCNLLITFCLAWLLCWAFFRTTINIPDSESGQCNLVVVIIAAITATAALVQLSNTPTPNYNGLALQALLLAGLGLLVAEKVGTRASVAGWGMIGVAGWLAFMAKPTTAAALGLVSVVYLFMAGKINLRLAAFAFCLALALLIASALLIDGSIVTFVERFKGGIEIGRQLEAGHSLEHIFRIDTLGLTNKDIPLARLFSVMAAGVFICTSLASSRRKGLVTLGHSLLLALILLSLAVISGIYTPGLRMGKNTGLLMWAVPIGLATAVILSPGRFLTGLLRNQWSLALCFIVFPYAYAFGTANNYWRQGSGAGIFWVISILVFVAHTIKTRADVRVILPGVVFIQLIVVLLLYRGMETPYRQPQPLWLNTQITAVGSSGSKLVLSPDFGEYINRARVLAQSAGFKPETPMIDLTGHSPGTVYILGAKAIGQPWMVGGYPGSGRLAQSMLDSVPCEDIARSWLLLEPSGNRRLSPEILKLYGIDLQEDFIKVGDLERPTGRRGNKGAYGQALFKPVRPLPAATRACRDQRALTR